MKKYVFTENQIKKVVDCVVSEQSEDLRSTVRTVQCFLNQVINANLKIDGLTGPNSQTENALKTFQTQKNKLGNNIDVDGVWGYKTQKTLTPQEQTIWHNCLRQYTLDEGQINELYKIEGHEFEIFKLHHGTIKAGKDGILGEHNILIPWDVIAKLLDKFKI
jgi:hypothetical protein